MFVLNVDNAGSTHKELIFLINILLRIFAPGNALILNKPASKISFIEEIPGPPPTLNIAEDIVFTEVEKTVL